MKTATNLTMSEMMNFDREVVNYINDNLQYIKENAAASENDDLAKESIDHYNESVEAAGDTDEYLSQEQKERFYEVAKRLFQQGFVEHSGMLND